MRLDDTPQLHVNSSPALVNVNDTDGAERSICGITVFIPMESRLILHRPGLKRLTLFHGILGK